MTDVGPFPIPEPARRIPTYAEELANSITHGVGSPLSVAATIQLIRRIPSSNPRLFWSVIVYGLSLFFVYTLSTIYHSVRRPSLKRLFQYGDHISIFLLIAGTFTPFALGPLWQSSGSTMLWWIWSAAAVGILGKLLFWDWFLKISLPYFLAMGWMCMLVVHDIVRTFPGAALVWLFVGGVCYTVGCLFFVKDRAFYHAIWHVFVLLGSAAHMVSVMKCCALPE
jgi:hemolysin III